MRLLSKFAILSIIFLLGSASAQNSSGDIDGNGEVNFQDFVIFAQNFGKKGGQVGPDTIQVTVFDTIYVSDSLQVTVYDTIKPNTPPILNQSLEGQEIKIVLLGGMEMEFIWIEPGTFLMGSPETETEANNNERPQHEVTINTGYYLSKYEITQAQWISVMEAYLPNSLAPYHPWVFPDLRTEQVPAGDNFPASYISWRDIQLFLNKINTTNAHYTFRLPTEEEWEYACRAGTTSRWSFGDRESLLTDYAWYYENTVAINEPYPHEVGLKLPNPWGLYDMHGNVHEWVASFWRPRYSQPEDTADKDLRVIRGGGFNWTKPEATKSAFRSSNSIENVRDILATGFRLVVISN